MSIWEDLFYTKTFWIWKTLACAFLLGSSLSLYALQQPNCLSSPPFITESGFHSGPYSVHLKYFITLLPSYQWHLLKMATLTVITVRWSHSSSPFCCYSKCLFLTTGLNWIIISGWKFLPWKRAADSEATGSWILHGHSNAGRFSTARNSSELQWVKLTKYCWPQSDSLAEPDFQHTIWSVLHTSTGRCLLTVI